MNNMILKNEKEILLMNKKICLLVRMPKDYTINGDAVSPYLVFSNSHDGSGSPAALLGLSDPVRSPDHDLMPAMLYSWLADTKYLLSYG